MADKLSEQELTAAVADSEWVTAGGALVLDREFADFASAWAFADQVAGLAEAADHHPDILAHGWNKVRVTLSTHSAGGVTQLDVDLSRAIDALHGH
ncbi:MAG: 4a-hydroxytetrahydrobiopterin dehydratase [Solirubrobacterales bacterium]|nr:4a-hydroxytetrahydrobiopterin dehydratase [Solirubrobacterales bacterium]